MHIKYREPPAKVPSLTLPSSSFHFKDGEAKGKHLQPPEKATTVLGRCGFWTRDASARAEEDAVASTRAEEHVR